MVKWLIMRFMVSLATMCRWELHHLDIKCAFLNGNIERKDIYLHQPPNYISQGLEHCVCLLGKTIYRFC